VVASAPIAPAKPSFALARVAAGLWGAMILGGLVIGAVGPDSWRDGLAHGGPGCPFRNATGIDCPFCGMTRATLAMGGGDFGRALEFHPLAPFVVLGILALLAIVVLGRTEVLLRGKRPFVLLATIMAVWVFRLVV
jgi:Protein of unknown function (DUF2752)